MANFKNSIYNKITDKRTIPYNQTGTGTIQTQGTGLIGTNTAFLTELKNGAWIVDLSQDEIRRVIGVTSNTVATLDVAFSVDIPALTALDYIAAQDQGPCEISVIIPIGNGDGEIDGEVFEAGIPASWGKASRDRSAQRDLIDPIIVDATGTIMNVIILA